jgi:hypothetical protein
MTMRVGPVIGWLLLLGVLPSAVRSQQAAPLSVLLASPDSVSPPRIRSLSDVSTCHAWTCDQAVSLALEVAPVASWRVGTEITGTRSVLWNGYRRVSDRRADLMYGSARRSVWLGYGLSTDDVGRVSTRLSRFEYGTAVRWKSLAVNASVGTGAVPVLVPGGSRIVTDELTVLDSVTGASHTDTVRRTVTDSASPSKARWSSTVLRVAWMSERWSAAAVVGRLAVSGGGRPLWGGIDGSRRLGRRFTMLARAGTFAGPPMSSRAAPRFAVSAGLLAQTSWFSTTPAERAPERGAAAFDVSSVGGDRYRLTIRVPGAARVDVASDVTTWQPVAMRRLRDDLWAVELSLTPGVHQLSVRADGGPWAAPAGLTPVDDDFGGSAGAFVVR